LNATLLTWRVAAADVADRECAVGAAVGVDAAKHVRSRDRQLAARHIAGNRDGFRPQWVVTIDRDRGGLRPDGGWLEADRYLEGVSRSDCQRIGDNLRWEELR